MNKQKTQQEFDKLWEEVEEYFDWDRVYQVMKLLDWQWSVEGHMAIPSIEYIKETARGVAYDAYNDNHTHATCGFYVAYGEDGLSVQFILTDWFAEK